jgi:hypothetical protein
MEQLLWALFARGGQEVSKAFADADVDEAKLRAVLSAKKFTPRELRGTFEPATRFSGHAQETMTAAAARAEGRPLTAMHLLDGARSVERCSLIIALNGIRKVTTSTLQMEDDDEIADDAFDRLQMVDFADAIAGVIDQLSAGSLTIAITAPWGAGKTSLARLIESRLTSKPAAGRDQPHVVCWFNAWLHDGAPDLAGAFAGELARAADAYRPAWRRAIEPLPSSLLSPAERRRRRLSIGLLVLAGLALSLYLQPNLVQKVLALLSGDKNQSGGVTAIAAFISALALLPKGFEWMNSATKALGAFVADPEKAAASGSMKQVRDQLTRLIKQATPGGIRFVVFIDDLERCTPPRPIDVLEAVNQLLSSADAVTILIADLPAVAACADIKYKTLADQKYDPDADRQAREGVKTSLSYGWLYLQKIVQLRFDVPPCTPSQVAKLLDTRPAADGAPEPDSPTLWPWPAWPRQPAVWKAWKNAARLTGEARTISIVLWIGALPGMVIRRVIENLMYPPSLRTNVAERPYGVWSTLTVLSSTWLPVLWFLVSGWVQIAAKGVPFPRHFGLTQLEWWRFLVTGELLAVLVVALVCGAVCGVRRYFDRQLLARARQRIHDNPAADRLGDISDAAMIRLRQEYEFRRLSESVVFAQARDEALKYLPRLPRNTKRLLNELRLLLYLCARRGLLEPGRLHAAHIGKWAAMRDRWPALARLLIARPALMAKLEREAKKEDYKKEDDAKTLKASSLAKTLDKLITELKDDTDLRDYLRNDPPLAEQMHRLARFADEAEA